MIHVSLVLQQGFCPDLWSIRYNNKDKFTSMVFLMRKLLVSAAFFVITQVASALSLEDISPGDASGGLKEALLQGAGNAITVLGHTDGFLKNPKVRIPLPKNLARGEKLMRMAGMGRKTDELVAAMNHAAEAAVPDARTLLVGAVEKMTISDARNILAGGDDSVTQFFKSSTVDDLTQKFIPIVRRHTETLQLAQKYNEYAATGAMLGLVKKEDADINQYVTRKALDGLYSVIADEERAIRANPAGASGSLARKVFGALNL